MLVSLELVKQYLRVDTADDDTLLLALIKSSEQLCRHILRVDEFDALLDSEEVKVAVLYAVAYLYEHREDGNHKELTLTLRSLLFGLRKVDF